MVMGDVNEEDLLSDWFKPVLDPYERKARLRPCLLCGLPLVASVVLLMPQLGPIWGSIGGVLLYSGASVWLIQIGRDLGKGLEERLFQSWGGMPSAAMLRHADGRLDKLTKERYRAFLTKSVPGLALASAEDERKNPASAFAGYESANRWLLEQTRDRARFELLFTENVNYGFRRNLLGLKRIGLGADAVALLLVVGVAFGSWTGQFTSTIKTLAPEWWASLLIAAMHTLALVVLVRTKWVRAAAETYARQLLATCDLLESGRHIST